jgi:hypothetical protein
MDKTDSTAAEELITTDEVQRVLVVGELRFSVLSPEEIKDLKDQLSQQRDIGNTGDS